jgi:hypothetical protein
VTTASNAIRLGFQQSASRWATSLFAVLASIGEVLAGATLMMAGVAYAEGGERSSAVAVGAGLAGLLASRILLALVQGGAVRQSGAWLKGQGTGSTMEEVLAAAPKSLAWFAWTLPIEVFASLWKWLGLAAVLFGYVHAIATREAGCSASLALSAFACIAFFLAVGWSLLSRATLVWTVRRANGPFHASADALLALVRRPGAFFAVLATGLFGAAALSAVISVMANALTPDQQGLEQILSGQLATGVLLAFGGAWFDLVILYGFTALEADATAVSSL